MLAGRKSNDKFLYKRGYILVGDNFAFPFLNGKDGCRNFDGHVRLYFHLTAQSPVILHLLSGEMHSFSGQRIATTIKHLHATLGA